MEGTVSSFGGRLTPCPREVAFISHLHGAPWSLERLAGVVDQYAAAGLEDAVHPILRTQLEDSTGLLLALSGFDQTVVEKIVAVNRTSEQAQQQLLAFKQIAGTGELTKHNFKSIQQLRKILAPLADTALGRSNAAALASITPLIMSRATAVLAEMVAAPLFDKALSFPKATAWICATDIAAFMALNYLKEREIAVPHRISVLGFDNLPVETLENRLTSFDFNATGFAYRILDFISRPPRPRRAYHHVHIEVEGVIMERGTTGRARQTNTGAA